MQFLFRWEVHYEGKRRIINPILNIQAVKIRFCMRPFLGRYHLQDNFTINIWTHSGSGWAKLQIVRHDQNNPIELINEFYWSFSLKKLLIFCTSNSRECMDSSMIENMSAIGNQFYNRNHQYVNLKGSYVYRRKFTVEIDSKGVEWS